MTRRPRLRSPLAAAHAAVAVILAVALFGATVCTDAHTQSQLDLDNPGFDPTVVVVLAPAELKPALAALDAAFKTSHPGTSFVLVSDVVGALRRALHRTQLPPTYDNAKTALTADMAPNVWIDASTTITALLPKTTTVYGPRGLFGLDQIALVVKAGNPDRVDGLSVFAAGSRVTTGWCRPRTACGVLARDALARAGVHAEPTHSTIASAPLLLAVLEGHLDAVLAMRSQAVSVGPGLTTIPISPPPARFLTYKTVRLDQSAIAATYTAWIAKSATAHRILAAYGFLSQPALAP